MRITNHKLESNNHDITFKLTECLSRPPEFPGEAYPDSVIIHYTAMNSADTAVNVLSKYKQGGRNASAHLVIAKDGKIWQLAPFNYKTWHAGTSSYNGRSSYNNFSIGIEIDNLGWLDEYNQGEYYSRPELMRLSTPIKRTPDEVVNKKHWNPRVRKEFWDEYTTEQIDAVKEICLALADIYNIKEILGHDEIAVNRKQDPGPAFPIDWLRSEVLFSERGDDAPPEPDFFETFEGKVNANKLNIRSGPGVHEDKVAKPLVSGTKVKVLEKSGEWYKISAKIEGWVSAKYIK